MPAAARTGPTRVRTTRVRRPSGRVRAATWETDAASSACSRSAAGTVRPSALATTFEATTTTSSSRRTVPAARSACATSPPRSSPADTGPMPGTATTRSPGGALTRCVRRSVHR